MRISLILIFLLLSELTSANDNEARSRALFDKVRCPTCQGQSVKESNAPAAEHIKRFIEHEVNAGKSDSEILKDLKQGFGEEITFDPGINIHTIILWIMPLLLFIYLVKKRFSLKK
jgi:cytochrome c-type biogenesis protein CcmH